MKHPYQKIHPYARWNASMSNVPGHEVDPVVSFPFKLRRTDKVATAGSCFAQHIANSLKKSGYNFYIAEPPHPFVQDVALNFGYEMFSARYGNIYTSRQLVQLAKRTLGLFQPIDDAWEGEDGRFFDPYRPTVQSGGFLSRDELSADTRQHLAAVKRMLESLDYFVFTLGLTECWVNTVDGAAYPICPGVAAGRFDERAHRFVNLTIAEVLGDMEEFFRILKSLNPKARMILTVSPVALAATAVDRHVLCSTVYSKSVLRVAAETLSSSHEDIAYFPSFEIITGAHSRGSYLEDDLRNVNQHGVSHVMSLFFKHATDPSEPVEEIAVAPIASAQEKMMSDIQTMIKVECDEEMLGRG